jgi:intein-encoded DNA endonuclease-like protein
MDLLRRFNIESRGPRIHVRRGTIINDPERGKKYTHDKDVYVIYVQASSNMSFYRYVGFTIRRKQIRLESYIKRSTRKPTPPPTISPIQHPQNNN